MKFQNLIFFFSLKRRYEIPQEHISLICDSPYVLRTLQMQLMRESTFVEFCVDGINLYVENNFIDSLGLGRDSNPDPSALKPSECTTTPYSSSNLIKSTGWILMKFWIWVLFLLFYQGKILTLFF